MFIDRALIPLSNREYGSMFEDFEHYYKAIAAYYANKGRQARLILWTVSCGFVGSVSAVLLERVPIWNWLVPMACFSVGFCFAVSLYRTIDWSSRADDERRERKRLRAEAQQFRPMS